MRRFSVLVVGFLSLVAAVLLGAGQATAVQAAETQPTEMTIVGIDVQVAEQAGLEVVRDGTGKPVSVRRPGADAGTEGFSAVYGPCGYSYLGFTGIGAHRASLSTGFTTYDRAIGYRWQVDIVDSRGHYRQQSWAGNIFLQNSWNATRQLSGLPTGQAWASVNPSYGYIQLWWGGICSTGNPNTTTYIS